MKSSIVTFVIAAAIASVLTPVVIRLARRLGAVDIGGGRRVHQGQIPRLGGIAVGVAFFAAVAVPGLLESAIGRRFFGEVDILIAIGGGGLLMLGTGMVDDVRGVRAWQKLLLQVGAASLAYGLGLRIDAITLPMIGKLELGLLAYPATVFWVVGIVNAINLIDGLDGLAGGVAFFVCVTNFAVAYLNHSVFVMLLSAGLAGAILGFLFYNFNPASIFMGDTGSLFLGYVLATTSMLGAATKSSTTVAIVVPLVALGLPVLDTLFAIWRRWLERRPLFSADRGHIHHRLGDLGGTHRRAVLLLYGLTILFAVGAIAVALGRSLEIGIALVLLCVALVGIVRFVGYFEYISLRRRASRLTPFTETLREAVPAILRDPNRQPDHLLGELCRRSAIVEWEVRRQKRTLRRHRCEGTKGRRRDFVAAVFTLGDGELIIRYTGSTVSPEDRILLQLVADTLDPDWVSSLSASAAHASGEFAASAADGS